MVEQLAFVCKGMGIAGGTLSKQAGAASFALIRGAAAVQIDAEILLKQLKQKRRRFGSADPQPDQYPDASRPEAQGISYRHLGMGVAKQGSLYANDLHWSATISSFTKQRHPLACPVKHARAACTSPEEYCLTWHALIWASHPRSP